MSTYESLVENLLVLKPNLQRSEVTKLVEAKKRRVGGGYLTDQGAIYLVASDLGVALERPSSDLGVKDLYIGAGEITVVTRLLGAYPVKSFSKKNGEEGCYRRLIIFEGEHNANLTCWDERAKLADELGLKSGDLIKIYKGYVRAGLDGSAALNLSEKGSIEKILENNELELKVAGLDSITKPISEIGSQDSHFVIKCTLKSPSKISEFVRKDGSAGSVHNLYVTDESGLSMRVVIWDPLEHREGIPENSLLRIINLRSRISNRNELEFHGDQSTKIEIMGNGTVSHAPVQTEAELQILSLGMIQLDDLGTRSISTLAVDKEGRDVNVVAKGTAMLAVESITNGAMIRVSLPHKALYAVIEDQEEITVSAANIDGSRKDRFTKMSDLDTVSPNIFTMGTALTSTRTRDVTTKDGSTVKRAEIDVGDDTAEITLVAWGSLCPLLEGLSPGQKLKVMAFHLQENGERTLLQARPYSSLETFSEP